MIGYVTIGTNDFDRAVAFYDALLGTIGLSRQWSTGRMAAWGTSRKDPVLSVCKPWDGNAATVGNGVMVALRVTERAQVDALHAKALELGGSDEGPPAPRGNRGFYGGYFRDLDGNKLNAHVPAS